MNRTSDFGTQSLLLRLQRIDQLLMPPRILIKQRKLSLTSVNCREQDQRFARTPLTRYRNHNPQERNPVFGELAGKAVLLFDFRLH